jgi:hypothetical protein
MVRATNLFGRSLTICHFCVDSEKATAPNGAFFSRTGGDPYTGKSVSLEHPASPKNTKTATIMAGNLKIPLNP